MTWRLGNAMLVLCLAALALAPRAGASEERSSCTPGPYIVFFDTNSSALKRDAVSVLDEMIGNDGNCGPGQPMLDAHSDNAENPEIAADRLRAVRNYLSSRGIFVPDRYASVHGATRLRVPTPPNTSDRRNRRVEIVYGPPDRAN